jgi:DNA polymerase-3 subunit gamma/tau
MYQVIARKYRPSKFSELISQEHVRTTLENAITQQRIAHGYILSGQRGTGKTTVARIIARCLNCANGPTPTPCGECASCLEIAAGNSVDVIEIDAASNRGINEMRELRDNVRYRPARDRFKVFIVDEAHQITSEAFNALLKTLEEPPEWVVFILCTTESHKIPVTIASRCQQFSFRSVDFVELVDRMRWICEQEGITADQEVLGVIAQVGEGSVRDSLSALDQAIACCGNTLCADDIRGLLGLFSLDSLQHVASALEEGNSQRMLEVVLELERNGRSLHHFCRELARYFRNLLVARISGGETRLIAASSGEQQQLYEVASRFSEVDLTRYLQLTLEMFKEMQTSLQPRLHLEIGLLRLIYAGRLTSIEEALSQVKSGPSGSSQSIGLPSAPATRPALSSAPDAFALPPVAPRSAAPVARASMPPSLQPSPKVAATPPAPSAPPPSAAAPTLAAEPAPAGNADLRSAIHGALIEMNCAFTADAVEQSEVSEQNGVLHFITSKTNAISMNEGDLKRAAQKALGRPYHVKVTVGTPVAAAPIAAASSAKSPAADAELLERALADPGVQSFRQAFPDAEIRQVRDLKE